MSKINRSLITLRTKKPFLDWARSLDDESKDLTLASLNEESTAYLIPEILAEHPTTGNSRYTQKQGQYLAFIFYYTKIHGRASAEAEMQTYFNVSPPSVHQMILTLEAKRLIERAPGQARSIRLMLAREDLPDLI